MTRHDDTQRENTTQHQPNMLCGRVLGCCNQTVDVKCWEVLRYVVVCDLLWCAMLGGSVLWSHEVRCGVLCCHVLWSGVMCCGLVSCALVQCHVVWCSVVGYCAIGLAVWFVEWWDGCLFSLACCYVGMFGRLGCMMGLLLV